MGLKSKEALEQQTAAGYTSMPIFFDDWSVLRCLPNPTLIASYTRETC
jgi:hypothetical protein